MNVIFSFPPIAAPDSRVLVLGSMPGEESLARQQYYAHPRNSFWYIIEQIFNAPSRLSYEQRKYLLVKNRVAVWDVLKACIRQGSLDSSIQPDSVVANAFEDFFSQHENISTVFFNGARAEQEFIRHVMPLAAAQSRSLAFHRLPSTSPAHAAMSREQKLDIWRMVAYKASLDLK